MLQRTCKAGNFCFIGRVKMRVKSVILTVMRAAMGGLLGGLIYIFPYINWNQGWSRIVFIANLIASIMTGIFIGTVVLLIQWRIKTDLMAFTRTLIGVALGILSSIIFTLFDNNEQASVLLTSTVFYTIWFGIAVGGLAGIFAGNSNRNG